MTVRKLDFSIPYESWTREEIDAVPMATPEQLEEIVKLMLSWRPEQLDDLKQRMDTLRSEGKCTPKK